MPKEYAKITGAINESLAKLSKESGEVLQAFQGLAKAATKPGALDEKTKELIALSVGIAKQCDACIGFHTKKLVALGVTREEFIETLNVSVYMGGGPSLMYAADALAAYEEFT